MKKYLLSLLGIFCSLFAFAQFEGTILWDFKMEITDPKMKAQIEQANKQMNSPEMKAQMKELEEKMKDPQFASMMEQNPEMKAMVEKQLEAMKSGSGGGSMLDNMMPKNMDIKLKNNNSLTKIIGGAFENEVLFLKDKETSYTIDRKNKTYSVLSNKEEKAPEYKITKTEESATILGYKCYKYMVEGTEQGQKMITNVWATTDIKDLDSKQFSKLKIGKGNQGAFISKIDGVPLKIQMTMPQGTMTMEVASLKKESLSAALFELPAGFVEKKSSY